MGTDMARQRLFDDEDYEQMLSAQGQRCAICETHAEDLDRALARDHDHRCCGKSAPGATRGCVNCVRGLLCNRCNRAIGMLRDDPLLLISAAAYLLVNARRRDALPT